MRQLQPSSVSRAIGFFTAALSVLALAGAASTARLSAGEAVQTLRPNIVLIVIDDLGWSDLGCYGSTFYRTPQIDRLAQDGIRFTSAYAGGPVCSPSRAALLTGKSPARLHMTDWLPGRQDRPSQKLLKPEIQRHLPLEEVTLAEALKPAGYVSASIGKWHLGGRGFLPQDQGFDVNIGGDDAGSPLTYFAPYRVGRRVMPGLEESEPGEYLTDRLTTEAERFIELNQKRPFFLYLSHFAVHIPLQGKTNLVRSFQDRPVGGPQTNAIYAAMIQSVDESVGRIVRKLAELNLSESTAILFTSDNGGLSVLEGPHTPATSNAPLREGKGYLYEGGIRVPLIFHWPARLPRNVLIDTPVIGMDLYATILSLAGVAPPEGIDGLNLVPLADHSQPWHRQALFWHYPHYSNQGGSPSGAIREQNLKLVQFLENGHLELYDLAKDPGESRNLAADFPERTAALRAELRAWRQSIGADMMEPNPEYRNPPDSTDRVVPQMADGRVFLHARDATVHGTTLRYEPEPQKNTLGYWTRQEDWASWNFEVNEPGAFRVELLQGCGTGSGGSEVELEVAGQEFKFVVQETGGFQNFTSRALGTITLNRTGRYQLTVKPLRKPGLAVMDLRSITLQPVNR